MFIVMTASRTISAPGAPELPLLSFRYEAQAGNSGSIGLRKYFLEKLVRFSEPIGTENAHSGE